MLGSLLCPRVVSCGFRCVLALAIVFAFCPSSKSYADELPDNSAYATTDENETISNDELEPLSNAVSRNELDYIGLVLDGTSGSIDWDLAKPEGASFGFVRAGEINSDGLFVQDDALFSNLECCRDFRVPFSVFVSGVKSSSDIALISDSLLPQLLAIDSPSLYFVLNDSEDNGSVLSAIAALQDEHPSIEFGVGADAAFLRDNASFMAEASIRGLAVDGYASGVDYANYYQLDRLVSVSGCSGSFAVIVSNCLPTEKHAVDDSGAVNEDGVDGSVTEVLTSETTQVESLNVRSSRSVPDGVYEVSSALDDWKALDVAGGSADDCARVQLWGSNSTAAQRFRLSYDEASGFYTIANVGSGKVLDAAAGRWEDGTAVQQYSANGTAAQLWSVEPDGEGYRVCSALNPSQVLDVPGADASDGAGIQLYGANGTAAQRWTLKCVSCPVNLHAEYSGNDIMAIDKYNGRLVIALPSSANPDLVALCIDEDFGSPVRVGASRLLEKGDRIALSEAGLGVSPGSETSCAVFDESGESLCTLVVMRSAECASVFLSSDDPQAEGRDYVEASPDHSASAKGNMLMLDASGSMVYEGELDQIKGRGNSTWSADKKPYQIKLKKKADLLQSGNSSNKNKTWVLLANAYDASGIRNVTSYSIAQDIGVKSPIEFRVVDLYYDAEYRGTYLLCEKVQINSGRVDIEDLEESNDEVNGGLDFSDDVEGVNSYGNPIRYTKDVVSPSDITGGYLIEFDGRYASERSWFSISTQWGLTYFVCESPEGWSYEEADYLSCYVQDAFDAMIDGGTNHRTGKTTGDYIDIASFTSLYWVNEITKNRDGFMFASTFAYKDSDSAAGDSRLIFGPAWDFDLSLGNLDETAGAASDWVANPTGWYTRATGIVPLFMRDPLVLNAMDDSKDIVIAAVRSYLAGEYLTHKYALESSMRLNSVVWGEANESCADVEDWLTKRLDWLSSL